MFRSIEEFGDAVETFREPSVTMGTSTTGLERRDAFSANATAQRLGNAEKIDEKFVKRQKFLSTLYFGVTSHRKEKTNIDFSRLRVTNFIVQ